MSLESNLQSAFTAVGNAVKAKISSSEKGQPNGVAPLDNGGKIPVGYLPSYESTITEYANLAGFPVSGDSSIVYVAADTNKTYRWSGTSYTQQTDGAVDSVNGKTGVVTLTKSDIGLSNVEDTADSAKNVLSATKLTTSRTITVGGSSKPFNGSANISFTLEEVGAQPIGNYQPLDDDLTAIRGIVVTNGILKKTAANTWVLDTNQYVTSSGVVSISTSGAITGGTITGTGTISHSTADGYLHVPATGTTNAGKVLTAGATPGSLSWVAIESGVTSVAGRTGAITLGISDITGLSTTLNEKASASSVTTLVNNIGPTDTDFVAVFNTALA